MNKIIIISATVAALVLAGFALLLSQPNQPANYDSLAQCLTDKGAVMYGAAWCSHCQAQKKDFGDAFRLINYVECPDQTELCLAKNISGYPTWIFSDGSRLEGAQSLADLSAKTACALPK
ncbi:MAG: thioredoxin domain-containing protein [Patescibacteria group bacterium]|nr:thioredoxin domain-containing protein [Patescibacteria group bacterium]